MSNSQGFSRDVWPSLVAASSYYQAECFVALTHQQHLPNSLEHYVLLGGKFSE